MNVASQMTRTGETGHTRHTGQPGHETGHGAGPRGLGGPVGPVKQAEAQRIVLPHGGYKKLIAYRKSVVVYLGTVVFCRRFLPAHGDRTVDQMVQAARSCKQNIAEGSASSGASKETEIKLTSVACATLDELMEDYLDWLASHGFPEWPANDRRRIAARDFAREHDDWKDWQAVFETRPAEAAANTMLTLCHQTRYLLDKMIAAQEEDFKRHGGVRERMHAVRSAVRGESWKASVVSWLEGASDEAELGVRVRELGRMAERVGWGIRRRRGWG